MRLHRFLGSTLGLFLCAFASTHAQPIELVAKDNKGQLLEKVDSGVGDRKVWQPNDKSMALTFKNSAPVSVPASGVVYLKIVYLDQGYGRMRPQLTGRDGKPVRPDRFLSLSLGDTKEFVTARMRVPGFQLPANGEINLRVNLDHAKDSVLSIESVTLQDTPFEDPTFSFVISDPWMGPYRGPSVKPPDNTTLKGKVMVGYQGWFRTPNDPEGNNWFHWGGVPQGNFSVDMWPDMSHYPKEVHEKAADVKLRSGKQAYLFSSNWPGVVDTHFRWMREHEIDGAFLQRFVGSIRSHTNGPEWVLANVRAAANREGRIWAVEYDVSGGNDATVFEILKKDWIWMVDTFRILEDPNYARENGKPVVFIWGFPFNSRGFSAPVANATIDFFKNDPKYGGNYVIGGIPSDWRRYPQEWQDHIRKYECVLPWMSRSYAQDIEDFKKLGLSYYAHVKPGFSWANLMHLPTGDETVAYEPRRGGKTYWNMLARAAHAGVDRLFVGMFDEYDEGTAIMPATDDPPPTPSRPGVAATFYNGANPSERGEFVLRPSMELELGDIAPAKKIDAQNFFVRMGGQIVFPKAGQYIFSIEGAPGDDVELVVNGKKILNARSLKETAVAKVQVAATANQALPYRLDYRHRTGSGTLRLFWESENVPREPVPDSAFLDAWGRFVTNEGKPADWWLQLTRMGREMINGKRKIDFAMPQPQ